MNLVLTQLYSLFIAYTVGHASFIAVSIDELTRADVNALEYVFDTLKRLLA